MKKYVKNNRFGRIQRKRQIKKPKFVQNLDFSLKKFIGCRYHMIFTNFVQNVDFSFQKFIGSAIYDFPQFCSKSWFFSWKKFIGDTIWFFPIEILFKMLIFLWKIHRRYHNYDWFPILFQIFIFLLKKVHWGYLMIFPNFV